MRYTWKKVDIGAIDTLGRQFEKVVRSVIKDLYQHGIHIWLLC